MEVEPAPNNARRLYAGVDVGAPVAVVWRALTDYDSLGSFIPGACARTRLRTHPCSRAAACSLPAATTWWWWCYCKLLHMRRATIRRQRSGLELQCRCNTNEWVRYQGG